MKNDFGPNWLGITWSLAVEEQFYIIIPLLIFLIKPKHIPKLLILCIIAAPVCRALIHNLGAYVLLPSRMDALALGVLIAYYYLNGAIEKLFSRRKWVLLLLLILACAALYFINENGNLNQIGGTYIHSVLALLYGTLLVLVLVANEKSFLQKSFPLLLCHLLHAFHTMMYLTHQIILGLLQQIILKEGFQILDYKGVLVSLLAMLATILFSTISYYAFEKPMLNLGKKYSY